MTQEALKLALEALENLRPEGYWNKAITAIKESLAQTQEPKIGCVNHDCEKCKAQKACVYCGQLVVKGNK
jgi:hypothetical protein